MNSKVIIFLLLIAILFAGCDISGVDTTESPTATESTSTSTATESPTSEATTPADASPSPTITITAETTTVKPTADSDKAQRTQDMNSYLPPLDTNLRFFGIAETGHYGQLSESYSSSDDALYIFNGTYDDGMGVPDEFKVQYFFDYNRGTITEKAGYNERLDKNEFHSKLHNIVVLKFPIYLGATWSHQTTIDGSKYWVYAEVTEYDDDAIKVLYTATGVPDYYNETYFEERTYEKGYGMTSFGNIISGDLDLSGVDTSDPDAVKEYILNMYMFGYSLDKS